MDETYIGGQASLELKAKMTQVVVIPGQSTRLPVEIHNTGDTADQVTLTFSGVPGEWLSLSETLIQLPAGESRQVDVQLRPPASERAIETLQLSLRAVSLEDPDRQSSAEVTVKLASVQVQGRIGIALEEQEVPMLPGGSASLTIGVINYGSQADDFELNVRGVPLAWVQISTPVVHVEPNAAANVQISVQPGEMKVDAGQYPLRVLVTSQSDPEQQASAEINLRIAAFETQGRIGVMLESVQFSVAPGGSASIPVLLINRGLQADNFRLSVEGVPVSWVSTATPVVSLQPGEKKRAVLMVQPPKSAESRGGRHRFKLIVGSQQAPDQKVEVDCILTVAVFSKFSSRLEPQRAQSDEPFAVYVQNLGNTQQTFNITVRGDGQGLVFSVLPSAEADRQVEPSEAAETSPETSAGEPSAVMEAPLRVEPGETGVLPFSAQPERRAWFGGQDIYPFTVQVSGSENQKQQHHGSLTTRALVPLWVLPLAAVFLLAIFCLGALLINRSGGRAASAAQTATYEAALLLGSTQTASVNQTQAAISGQQDTDGDGLTDAEEAQLGTDPTNPDTDGDELQDGPEVRQYATNPLVPDSDGEGLTDGDEVLRWMTDPNNPDTDGDELSDSEEALRRNTNPTNPDTDGDGLSDGEEVLRRNTDPLSPDTDRDNLNDGAEVQLGTDPLNPDTDNDQLLDGAETPPCPDPLNPDTDADGIIDGVDLDPCDPNNPSLTATAGAGNPPPVATTAVPSTDVPQGTATSMPPTEPPVQPPPSLSGRIAFDSNREGGFGLFVMNGSDLSPVRVPVDGNAFQAVLSPDGNRLAFTSDRDGNNEIYVVNLDGAGLANVTNSPSDDQFPSWSPDGQALAFTSDRDGNREIYTVRLDGSDLTNRTNSPSDDFAPSWFSSGGLLSNRQVIVFTTDRDGNQEIYLMNSDGSEPQNLSQNPASDSFPTGRSSGNRVLFVSDRDGNPEIYIMGVDGTGQTNISNNPAADSDPFWSPDGERLVFSTNRDGNTEIYAMRTDGSELANLTNNPAEDRHPSWR